MSKVKPAAKTQYVCSACGGVQMKWLGKCPECGEWNTLQEVIIAVPEKGRTAMPTAGISDGKPISLPDISLDGMPRIPLQMAELNRVLGGGIVPGLMRAGGWRSGHRQIDDTAANGS
jgi:DNA repair protein RadA/Sms